MLSDADVISLRTRKARGEPISPKDEADKFGVSIETIRRLLRNETFRHLVVPAEVPLDAAAAEGFERLLSEVSSEETDIQALLNGLGSADSK